MPGPGLDDVVRGYELPRTAPGQLIGQFNLASNAPVYITPGFGGGGTGSLPPIQTGSAHYDLTITHYLDQAAVEAREQ